MERTACLANFLNFDACRLLARRWFAMDFQAQDDKFIKLNRKIVAGGAVGNNDIRSPQTTLRCLAA